VKRAWILLAVLLVAACGGGSNNKRLTHPQFVVAVERLCAQATNQVRQIPAASGSQLHKDERFSSHVLEIQTKFLKDARKLRPPVRDDALWTKALAYNEKLHATWGRIHDAAARGDAAVARAAAQHLQAIAQNPYYQHLGLKGC
jgi:hypothetical protein